MKTSLEMARYSVQTFAFPSMPNRLSKSWGRTSQRLKGPLQPRARYELNKYSYGDTNRNFDFILLQTSPLIESSSHVLVMQPGTTVMINGPNAPTESNLETWLKSHPTFHAVLPWNDPKSKFYGHKTTKFYG